jgi:hypothetical protein
MWSKGFFLYTGVWSKVFFINHRGTEKAEKKRGESQRRIRIELSLGNRKAYLAN